MNTTPLLSIQGLTIAIQDTDLVRNVSFDVSHGETVALVGESGCGKSLTAQAITSLFIHPGPRVRTGAIIFNGEDITHANFSIKKELLQNHIACISQNPLQALNPTLTIGYQMMEATSKQRFPSRKERQLVVRDMCRLVNLSDIERRLTSYPHELSGGMRQRILIAMALINRPQLVIADEPTTALDVTIQAEIIELLKQLQKDLRMSLLFITHDLGVVAALANQVVVMYAGQVVETSPVDELYTSPKHPYTRALLDAIPALNNTQKPLQAIPGQPPMCGVNAHHCMFSNRCPKMSDLCIQKEPPLVQLGTKKSVRCFLESSL